MLSLIIKQLYKEYLKYIKVDNQIYCYLYNILVLFKYDFYKNLFISNDIFFSLI